MIPEELTPEEAAVQLKKLKKATVKVLEETICSIKEERFNKVDLSSSSSGDGYGCNNCYLDFSDVIPNIRSDSESTDLGDVIDVLERLRKIKLPQENKSRKRKKSGLK